MQSIKPVYSLFRLPHFPLLVLATGMLAAALSLPQPVAAQTPPTDWKAFLKLAARNQDLSGAYRDRCVYQMKIGVTRYKNKQGDWKEEIVSNRKTTIEAAPNEKSEVQTRMLADTDDKGRPRKADPKERTLLGAVNFLEALFFPFYPEKIARYDLGAADIVEVNGQRLLSVAFIPRADSADMPLVDCTGYFVPATGELVKLEIRSLRNFEILSKEFSKLQTLEVQVEYAPAPDGLRLPLRATGRGVGRLKQLNGMFRFTYEESGHTKSERYK